MRKQLLVLPGEGGGWNSVSVEVWKEGDIDCQRDSLRG